MCGSNPLGQGSNPWSPVSARIIKQVKTEAGQDNNIIGKQKREQKPMRIKRNLSPLNIWDSSSVGRAED